MARTSERSKPENNTVSRKHSVFANIPHTCTAYIVLAEQIESAFDPIHTIVSDMSARKAECRKTKIRQERRHIASSINTQTVLELFVHLPRQCPVQRSKRRIGMLDGILNYGKKWIYARIAECILGIECRQINITGTNNSDSFFGRTAKNRGRKNNANYVS